MAVISQARSGEITIRLIERSNSNFVLVLNSPRLAAFQGWTTDRGHADRIFERAIELAEFGSRHPAWKKPAIQTIQFNGE